MASSHPEKSTNVRHGIAALRGVVAVADRLSPRVAARLAVRSFLSPPRGARPAPEVALLAVATPLTVVRERHAIAAWSWGEGPTVLLVHGWGGRGTQLGALIPPLVNAGFRVVAFDATAHGDSDAHQLTLAHLAREVRAVADAAGGVEAIVAHSFGAAATTVALAQGLTARRVVYVAPVFGIEAAIDRFAAAAGLSARARTVFVAALADANQASALALDGRALAPAQTAALTVIHDVGDREVPFAEGAATVQALAGRAHGRDRGPRAPSYPRRPRRRRRDPRRAPRRRGAAPAARRRRADRSRAAGPRQPSPPRVSLT